ncbi:hypothetical protein BDU57DRAFT_582678 [Ampelomyces quisqualis]|uniref:PWWP domain-containing protein n=1 Tax=Ampelomyces quisqualis TaxID=50730 RepID=A0A6A5QAL2_AMPQU|nr:hypothetical protein BDU57DRAFT_582678 [Ampelomyces quisqualis]
MADETNAPAVADTAQSIEEPAPSADAIAEPAVAEAKPAEGEIVATSGVAEGKVPEDTGEEPVAEPEDPASAQPETEAASDDAEAAPATDAPTSNGTPSASKTTNGKRKSGAGVPEHKKKTPAKKKKAAPELRLDVSPGEMYMVAMRGYQPWPVIICDEEMLPESLLSKRPVSAKRIDGTYREDFLEGGKNAKDRRYPVMFLGTNEFAWQVNTELLHFDIEDVKKDAETGKQGKKTKALWEAYQIAAEGHDLAHFKQVLANHEAAMQQDLEQREQKEQDKKEKAEKSTKRKSTAVVSSEDVDMEDAGDGATAPSAKKAKATKKRKKDDESDGENEKPAKTPKTKLKLTTKTPKDASAAKPKKEPKSKKKSSEEADPAPLEEPPLTEEERLAKREKQVLYLRHRLQKGFLSRDQAPKDDDMANMSDYLKQLELHDDLEAEVIKKTKVHKVLKAIVKLNSIPKEEEFGFKQRSSELLTKWTGALAADEPAAAPMETATNGVKHDEDEKSQPTKEESPVDRKEDMPAEEKKDNTPAGSTPAAKAAVVDGDVSMADADKDLDKIEPAIKADTDSNVEASVEAATGIETVPVSADAATS